MTRLFDTDRERMIIGLSGYARSGKGEIAKHLVEKHGFIEMAFADTLRDVLLDLDPMLPVLLGSSSLGTVIGHYGWEGVKSTPYAADVRRELQNTGSVMRKHFGADIWTKALMRKVDSFPQGKIVISDVRYMGEAIAVSLDRVGEIWRVRRPGVEPINGHDSEIGLDSWEFDTIIDNDGSLDSLHEKVDRALARYSW